MQVQGSLGFFDRAVQKPRSPIKTTICNYAILCSFGDFALKYSLRDPYPLGSDVSNYYFSNNTLEFYDGFFSTVLSFFYKKQGVKKLSSEVMSDLKKSNTLQKDYDEFLDCCYLAEKASTFINLVTDCVEREISNRSFFNIPINDFLQLSNPPITLATEEKIRAVREADDLSDEELGKKYSWLVLKEYLSNGAAVAGRRLREILSSFDVERMLRLKQEKEEFIKSYPFKSEEAELFIENLREWNYLSCYAHKPVLLSRAKSRKLREEIGKRFGISHFDVLYCLPHEIMSGTVDKSVIRKRKKGYKTIMLKQGTLVEL